MTTRQDRGEYSNEDLSRIEQLIDAALEYSRACDELNYPALRLLAQRLKSTSRVLRWQLEDINPPAHVRLKHERKT